MSRRGEGGAQNLSAFHPPRAHSTRPEPRPAAREQRDSMLLCWTGQSGRVLRCVWAAYILQSERRTNSPAARRASVGASLPAPGARSAAAAFGPALCRSLAFSAHKFPSARTLHPAQRTSLVTFRTIGWPRSLRCSSRVNGSPRLRMAPSPRRGSTCPRSTLGWTRSRASRGGSQAGAQRQVRQAMRESDSLPFRDSFWSL